MDEARRILLDFDDGLITKEQAILRLDSLAARQEIPASVAIGFICNILNEEEKHGIPGTQADSS